MKRMADCQHFGGTWRRMTEAEDKCPVVTLSGKKSLLVDSIQECLQTSLFVDILEQILSNFHKSNSWRIGKSQLKNAGFRDAHLAESSSCFLYLINLKHRPCSADRTFSLFSTNQDEIRFPRNVEQISLPGLTEERGPISSAEFGLDPWRGRSPAKIIISK